jgi:regulator of RNase E activity RraA
VVVPQEMAEKVLEAAQAIEEAESSIVEAIRGGMSLKEARQKFSYHKLQSKTT